MEVRSVSTAFSDFVLAGCSLYVAWMVYNSSVYASWGFMGIALAASFGVLKFGVVFPSFQPKVVRMHVISTWIASVLGKARTFQREVCPQATQAIRCLLNFPNPMSGISFIIKCFIKNAKKLSWL